MEIYDEYGSLSYSYLRPKCTAWTVSEHLPNLKLRKLWMMDLTLKVGKT